MSKLAKEIAIVGLATAVIGTVIAYISIGRDVKCSSALRGFGTKPNASLWKKLILTFFLTGAIIHSLAEITGVNKWYCNNGHACVM